MFDEREGRRFKDSLENNCNESFELCDDLISKQRGEKAQGNSELFESSIYTVELRFLDGTGL